MLGTQEFYEAMQVFEKTMKSSSAPRIMQGSQGFTKEPKENWEKRNYYSDGNTNQAFKIFLLGYSYAKSCFTM